jgi:hypothetical protein
MNKYIFLDIDGVLATPESLKDGYWALVDARQKQFKKLMEKPKNTFSFNWIEPKIVLSSSWRKWDLETTRQFMKEEGFWYWEKIIGVTIRAYQYLDNSKKIHLSIPRGVEIKQWIDANIHSDNGKNYNRKKIGVDYTYLILDDESDMLLEQKDHFVKTHPTKGLTAKDIEKANLILNKYD